MKITQYYFQNLSWTTPLPKDSDETLVLVFGSRWVFENTACLMSIKRAFPRAVFLGCSTAGEILHHQVCDNTLTVTAIQFRDTFVHAEMQKISSAHQSFAVGQKLASQMPQDKLTHVFLLCEGLHVNGSDLVRGFTLGLPEHVTVSGGLSADGEAFQKTLVLNQNVEPEENIVVAVGFYGDAIKVGCASLGGWDPYGPEHTITRSQDHVVYEIDNQPALKVYKDALGEEAKNLPASGLLFPLSVLSVHRSETSVVRTILSVDEEAQTLTFAGTMPQGARTQFMQANFDRLIEGAKNAAKISLRNKTQNPELAILISCVGRKLILKERVVDEVLAVQSVLGHTMPLTGFYSYGEISPFVWGTKCELHNQTMTITTLSEK